MRFYLKPSLIHYLAPVILAVVMNTAILPAQILFAQSKPSDSQSSSEVILTIDASGSMWGRVGGQPKYIIVRSALTDALDKLKTPLNFGLVSYGHRYKRNCQDVELLMPASSYDVAGFRNILKNLTPRGRTPISTALERADKALGQKNRPGTIILLSDGLENCNRDPCAVAGILKNERPELKVHVLGLGLNPRDLNSLKCIADKTGGTIENTVSQTELTVALKRLFIRIGQPVIPEPQIVDKPAEKVKPGLRLKAIFAGAGKEIRDGMQWVILDKEPSAERKANVIARSDEAQPIFELKPGPYFVIAKYGLVTVGRAVTVKRDDSTNETIPIRAGSLRIQTVAHEGGELLSNVSYRIYSLELDTGRKIKPIARTTGTSASFQVPVGTYRIIAEKDLARVERAITIRPGQLLDLSLVLNVGTMALSATDSQNGRPLKKVFYFVHETDPDTLREGREVIRTGASTPAFDLPAGNYIVRVEHGYATTQKRITVHPGKITRKSIVMDSAELALSSEIVGNNSDVEDQLSYKIYSLSQSAETGGIEIARTSRPAPIFHLKSGAYRIVSKLGYVNGLAETTAFLEAGKRTNIKMLHRVGLISAELEHQNGTVALEAIFWTLRDRFGRELWRTSRPRPEFILKSGTYTIIAESGGRRFERKFSVTTGDKKVVMLNAK